MAQSSVTRLQDTPQLIFIESFILFFPSDNLILQIDLRVLVNSVQFISSGAQPLDSVSLDLKDSQHVLTSALAHFFLQTPPLLLIHPLGGIGKLFQQIGLLIFVMLQHDSLTVLLEFLELGQNIDIQLLLRVTRVAHMNLTDNYKLILNRLYFINNLYQWESQSSAVRESTFTSRTK